MLEKKRHPFILIFNILLFFFVIISGGNDIVDISIKNATPLLALPLLCGFSIFSSVEAAVVAGLLSGIMLDSVSMNTFCFNAIVFLILGVFVSLASNTLFNKNLKAAAALSLIISSAYFVLYWLCFAAVGTGIRNSLIYLLQYGLPSAVYSSVFIFPFYFIFRYFDKIKNK